MTPAELAASVWRIERSALIGAAAKLLRDLDEAEDCAQEALIQALETWPRDGTPTHPAAWLMTTTRHRALDRLRRKAMLAREHEALAADDLALQAHLECEGLDHSGCLAVGGMSTIAAEATEGVPAVCGAWSLSHLSL